MSHASRYFTRLTAIFLFFFMMSCTKQNQEGNAIESSSKLSSESIENSSVDSKKIYPENSSADSKDDLIDVLMNEGFTKKEAEKATLKVGLK